MKILVVKHVPDPRRDEPRNVGVIVVNEVRAAGKFFGEVDGGGLVSSGVLRKRLGSPPEIYAEWYQFWKRSLADGAEGVAKLRAVPRSNYYVVEAAEVWLDAGLDHSVEELADHYYSVLVDEAASSDETFIKRVRLIIRESGLDRHPHFKRDHGIPSNRLDPPEVFQFPYAYVNGAVRVADRVRLDEAHRVYSSLFRFEHIARGIQKVALVWPEGTPDDVSDRHLGQLSRLATVIDVSASNADLQLARAFKL